MFTPFNIANIFLTLALSLKNNMTVPSQMKTLVQQ